MTQQLAVFVSHYGATPRAVGDLTRHLTKIARQSQAFDLILVDDGSPWADDLRSRHGADVLIRGGSVRGLDLGAFWLPIDGIFLGRSTSTFRKAVALNKAVSNVPAAKLVFLDDDMHWRCRGAVRTFSLLLDEYAFVCGRTQLSDGTFVLFDDVAVSGSNIAVSRRLFDSIGGFNPVTEEWGHGLDADLYWRVYDRDTTEL